MSTFGSPSRVSDGRAAIARRLTLAAGAAVSHIGYFDWVNQRYAEAWVGYGDDHPHSRNDEITRMLTRSIRGALPKIDLSLRRRGAGMRGSEAVAWIRSRKTLIGIGERVGPLVAVAAFVSDRPELVRSAQCEPLLEIGLSYSVQILREDMANRRKTQDRITDSILRSLSLSFMVVDAQGMIDYQNNLAEDWLEDRCQLAVNGGRLAGQSKHVQQMLQVAILGATAETARTSILQLDAEGGMPQTVVVLPIETAPRRALLVFGQETADAALRDLLLETFGLTLAERRLARHLLAGKSLADAAEATSLKISTARSYLKRIFAKTGINRQSQLISLYHSLMPPVKMTAVEEEPAPGRLPAAE